MRSREREPLVDGNMYGVYSLSRAFAIDAATITEVRRVTVEELRPDSRGTVSFPGKRGKYNLSAGDLTALKITLPIGMQPDIFWAAVDRVEKVLKSTPAADTVLGKSYRSALAEEQQARATNLRTWIRRVGPRAVVVADQERERVDAVGADRLSRSRVGKRRTA